MKRKLINSDTNPTVKEDNFKRLKAQQYKDEIADTSHDTHSHSSDSVEITESPEKITPKQQSITDEYILEKAQKGDIDFVKNNLSKIANINQTDKEGYSLLHHAIYNNSLELVKLLEKNGANLDNTGNGTPAPILLAAGLKNVELDILRFLTDHKANINVKDHYNYNVIHEAVNSENPEKLTFLLSLPSSREMINQAGNFGDTPIENAIKTQNIENITLLLNNGAKITFNAITEAIHGGNINVLNFLSQKDFDWNMKSEDGNNLLHVALTSKTDKPIKANKIAKFLVNLGISETDQNNEGLTPLQAYEKQKLDDFYDIPYNTTLYDSDYE